MAAGEEGDEGLSSTQEAEVGAWVVDWKGAILMEGREGVKFGACGAELWTAASTSYLAIRIVVALAATRVYQSANGIFLSQQTSISRTYQPRNQPANRLEDGSLIFG